MEATAEWLTNMGMAIIPYSFAFYFPLRWLEYVWDRGPTRLVKGAWYAALGMSYLNGAVEVETIVMYICFIEAWDLLFQQMEVWRDKRRLSQGTDVGPNVLAPQSS